MGKGLLKSMRRAQSYPKTLLLFCPRVLPMIREEIKLRGDEDSVESFLVSCIM